MRVINKPYTLWDNFNLFKNMLMSALLVSILIGFLIGISGLEFFSRSVNRIQMYIRENKISGMSFENKYIRHFLKMSFHLLDVPICAADKIGDVRLRTWIKITSVLFLSFTIIYVTYIVTYIVVITVLALVMVAIIIWIIVSLLGGSPSGGSIGGGGGSGGGKDYTTKYGKTYDPETDERVVKQDGKTYRRGSIFELDAGWHADTEWTGDDKVERDWDGSPKIRRDVTGKQIIEGDSSGDPIIEPESERGK